MTDKERSGLIIKELVNRIVDITFAYQYPVGYCVPVLLGKNRAQYCEKNQCDCTVCRRSIIANYRKNLTEEYLKKNNSSS